MHVDHLSTYHHFDDPNPKVLVPHRVKPNARPPQPPFQLLKAAAHDKLHAFLESEFHREGTGPFQHLSITVVAAATQDNKSHVVEWPATKAPRGSCLAFGKFSQGCQRSYLKGVVLLGSKLPNG